MRHILKNKVNFLIALVACLLVSAIAPAALRAGAQESDVDMLKEVSLTGIADGKTAKLGDLAKGLPFFLVFSTPT